MRVALMVPDPAYAEPYAWTYDVEAAILTKVGIEVQPLPWTMTGKLPYGDILTYQVGRYSKSRSVVAPSQIRPDVPIWLDHIVLKAISITQNQRFETSEEFLLAIERGAARPLLAPTKSSMLERDPQAIWKIGLGISVLVNILLIYWLLFLPR